MASRRQILADSYDIGKLTRWKRGGAIDEPLGNAGQRRYNPALTEADCSTCTESVTRVVGIDDWAQRKGHSYGTIFIDLERRCVVDLLSDRSAETVETVKEIGGYTA